MKRFILEFKGQKIEFKGVYSRQNYIKTNSVVYGLCYALGDDNKLMDGTRYSFNMNY